MSWGCLHVPGMDVYVPALDMWWCEYVPCVCVCVSEAARACARSIITGSHPEKRGRVRRPCRTEGGLGLGKGRRLQMRSWGEGPGNSAVTMATSVLGAHPPHRSGQ